MKIEVKRYLDAPPAEIFAIVSDLESWPEIIRSVQRMELLTDGPLGQGTKLRETRVIFSRTSVHDLEIADLDRPHRLRLLVANPEIHYELDHLIDRVFGSSTRVLMILHAQPESSVGHAVHPFTTPFMEITVRDELERDLIDLVAAVKLQR
jgi:hypothetical protein